LAELPYRISTAALPVAFFGVTLRGTQQFSGLAKPI
jgi:hypothetical protein